MRHSCFRLLILLPRPPFLLKVQLRTALLRYIAAMARLSGPGRCCPRRKACPCHGGGRRQLCPPVGLPVPSQPQPYLCVVLLAVPSRGGLPRPQPFWWGQVRRWREANAHRQTKHNVSSDCCGGNHDVCNDRTPRYKLMLYSFTKIITLSDRRLSHA